MPEQGVNYYLTCLVSSEYCRRRTAATHCCDISARCASCYLHVPIQTLCASTFRTSAELQTKWLK